MKTIKIISSIIGFMLCFGSVYAQTNFTYSYDAAGNRIRREVAENQPRMLSVVDTSNTSEKEQNTLSQNLPAFAVTLFPNPTTGHLTLELPELRAGEQGSVSIHNGMGQVVYQQAAVTHVQTLNLYNHPAGFYLIRILVGDKMVMRTIIKQ